MEEALVIKRASSQHELLILKVDTYMLKLTCNIPKVCSKYSKIIFISEVQDKEIVIVNIKTPEPGECYVDMLVLSSTEFS